jgi:C-terminal processing protease CtpA/Prc
MFEATPLTGQWQSNVINPHGDGPMRILMPSLIALTLTATLSTPLTVPALAASQSSDIAAPVQAPVKMLSAAQAKADIALLRRGLETVHPGLTRYTDKKDIDAAFARLEAIANAPVDTLTLHREIALMLAQIHCDHTKAEMPDVLTEYRESNATHLPLRFRLIEGRMIILSNDGQPGSPPVGSEILAINGKQVPALLVTLGKAVAYDGNTDQAIAAKLGDDGDLMGDDFNENYPGFFGFPKEWVIVWKLVGAEKQTSVTLKPVTFDRWTKLAAPESVFRSEFYKSIGWHTDGETAQLQIGTFVNYRNPVETTAFMGSFFKTMKANGTKHLILDLRGNGGGSEDVSVALGRYLFDTPFVWTKPLVYKAIRYGDLPDHIDSWGDRDALFNPDAASFTKTPGGMFERKVDLTAPESDDGNTAIAHNPISDLHFGGRLTLLTDARNGSAVTRLIAQFKEKRAARIVGEDSAGSAEGPTAGQLFVLNLPNSGIKVRIPNAWSRTNIESFTPRRGVAVDELVLPTIADFGVGRDRQLEVAQALPQPVVSQQRAALLAQAFKGKWSGTLDYRDYGNDGRVTLPTLLASDGKVLNWTYDDGPGKIVKTTESWNYDVNTGRVMIDKQAYIISEFAVSDKDKNELTMVLDGRTAENEVKKLARIIVARRGDTVSITRMSRLAGEPFIMRDSYTMTRGGE